MTTITVKAISDWSNTAGQTDFRALDNGAVAIQQADGLLFSRKPDGSTRATDLRPMSEQLASGPLADALPRKTPVRLAPELTWDGAINRLLAAGVAVSLAAATYTVAAPLILQQGSNIKGAGEGLTRIKLADGANCDVVQTQGAYSLFGSGTGGGVHRWSISDVTIDGSRSTQTATGAAIDAVNGLAVYGAKWDLHNVAILNCLGHGIRSEWGDGGPSGGLESSLQNVTIDTVGRHGWWFNGPHDADAVKLVVIDASQEADNTYDGVLVGTKGNGRFFDFHGWHRSTATNRVAYQFYSNGSNQIVASHLEGGRSQIYHAGNYDTVIGSFIYAPFGPTGNSLVVFAGNNNTHTGNQYQGTSGIANYALQFGTSTKSVVYNRVTDGQFIAFNTSGPFNFVNDGGANKITGYGYANPGGAAAFAGTKNLATEIDYVQGGTGVNVGSWKLRANAPASATSPGEYGQLTFDGGYLYVCVATNTWKRVAVAPW